MTRFLVPSQQPQRVAVTQSKDLCLPCHIITFCPVGFLMPSAVLNVLIPMFETSSIHVISHQSNIIYLVLPLLCGFDSIHSSICSLIIDNHTDFTNSETLISCLVVTTPFATTQHVQTLHLRVAVHIKLLLSSPAMRCDQISYSVPGNFMVSHFLYIFCLLHSEVLL